MPFADVFVISSPMNPPGAGWHFESSKFVATRRMRAQIIACFLLIWWLSGITAFPQVPVTATNVVTAHPAFRIVNGQLYNTDVSTNFTMIGGQCVIVLTNGVIVQQFEVKQTLTYPTNAAELGVALSNRSSQIIKEEVIPGKKVFIRNYPNQPLVVVGSPVAARAMRDGVFTYESEIIEQWDYGTPNQVAVVTTNAVATNAPSAGVNKR